MLYFVVSLCVAYTIGDLLLFRNRLKKRWYVRGYRQARWDHEVYGEV